MIRKLLLASAFTFGSLAAMHHGTSIQGECYGGVPHQFGTESISDLPESISNPEGCLNMYNVLGAIGVTAGTGGLVLTALQPLCGRRYADYNGEPVDLPQHVIDAIKQHQLESQQDQPQHD